MPKQTITEHIKEIEIETKDFDSNHKAGRFIIKSVVYDED